MIRHLFDTNIYNKILDENIDVTTFLKQKNLFCDTHVQIDELEATPDKTRKKELINCFLSIPSKRISTEDSIWNVSNWNESKWSEDKQVEFIFQEVKEADKRNKKQKSEKNIWRDALIANTCLKLNYILVTNDIALKEVVNSIRNIAISFEQFCKKHRKIFLNK